MTRAEYLSAVNEFFYQGEVLGEAVFACFAALEGDPERRRKWVNCLQLETETKARLRPFLARLGLSVAQDDVRATVAELAQSYASKSWRQHMADMIHITDQYLEKFRAIEASAPPEEREMARSMIVHETALNDFARRELAGDSAQSLDGILQELRYPIR